VRTRPLRRLAACGPTSRASADSQSAISTRTSGSSSTPYRVLPRKPCWPGPCAAIKLSSTPLSSSRRPGLARNSTMLARTRTGQRTTLPIALPGLATTAGAMTMPQAGGHDAELLNERQHVRHAPVLADQASTVEPHDVDQLHI
jgi:hypothetical protein